MSASRPCEALLGLPVGHAHSSLRAALMAMNVVPNPLPPDVRQQLARLRSLGDDVRRVAFIDISDRRPSLIELDRGLPRGPSRARIFLTRLHGGHVSEAEQRWAAALGFGGLWSELGTDAPTSDHPAALQDALERVAAAVGMTAPSPEQTKRHVGSTRGPAEHPARDRIRSLTGASAEAAAALLARRLRIRDRQYHLQTYRACFVGRSAVRAITSTFGGTTGDALDVGRALHALGLLAHVTHEHDFEDADYFYRLAVSRRADGVELQGALRALLDHIEVDDRSWHGRSYPHCWIGDDAVGLFVGRFGLERHQAWIVLHRLMQAGAFDHVTAERPFIDGHFFYRFASALSPQPEPQARSSTQPTSGQMLPTW